MEEKAAMAAAAAQAKEDKKLLSKLKKAKKAAAHMFRIGATSPPRSPRGSDATPDPFD